MEINKLGCETRANYTPQGTTKFSQVAWLLGVRRGQDISATAGLAAFQTTLQSKLVNNDPNQRAILIPVMMPEFNGEAVAYETIGQHKSKAGKGTWDYIFTIDNADGGSICDRLQLNTIEGKAWEWALIDDKEQVKYLVSSTGIKGMPGHSFEVLNAELATPSTVEKVKIRVALKNVDDYNKHAKHSALGFDPAVLRGVQNWTLEDVTPGGATAGVFDVAIKGTCPDCSTSDNNMVELYKSAWSAACFSAKNSDGDDLTISSVALVNSGTEAVAVRITLDTNDTDYTNNDNASLGLAGVSTLFGVIAEYAEADALTVVTTV